jgi:hypothetical protein
VTLIRPRLDDAACRGREDLYLKSNPDRAELTVMRVICGDCLDRPECLAYALEREIGGFWGGHSARERTALRKKYGITLEPILIGMWVGSTNQPSGGTYGEDQAAD